MLRDILQLLRKDNLQAQALQECHEMLDLCRGMVDAAVETLRHRDDSEIGIDILARDKRINAFERDVRRKVMTHLSLGNRGDLSAGLVLISIVIDIERIGDYSKNIHDLALSHPPKLQGGELEPLLGRIESGTLDLFSRACDAFKRSDEEKARKLMTEYKDEISTACHELEAALVSGEVETDSRTATALALYARFLKRISAHARNLASSVVNPFDRIGYPE